jgi:hypothetical protein
LGVILSILMAGVGGLEELELELEEEVVTVL